MVGGLLGSFLIFVGTLFTKWLDTRNSRNAEQRRAAREVLILVERFAREHGELRDEPSGGDAWVRKRTALEGLTDEIAARALEIDHGVAREHMRAIANALWYCINKAAQSVPPEPRPFPDVPLVRKAAREVLGAVMRDDDIPRSFDSETMRLLGTAREARALLEGALKTLRTP